jgi:ankyrin repeat protein
MSEIDDLMHAIWDDDIRTVRRLLQQKPERALEADEHGVTALMRAAASSERSVQVVQALLDAGADVKAKTSDNNTVLHFAMDTNSPGCAGVVPGRVIKLLADAGAPLEERNSWGWTPLLRGVVEGSFDELRGLLDVGCNPNVFFPMHTLPEFMRGCSALSGTVLLSGAERTELLLTYGADPHARDLYGQTALEVALQVLEESETEIVSLSEETLSILPKPMSEMQADSRYERMESVRLIKKAMAAST